MSIGAEILGVAAIAATVLAGLETGQDGPIVSVPHVTLEVSGERDHTLPHTIVIETVRTRPPRDEAELSAEHWTATRVSARGTDQITSDECPGLREVALGFRDLPAIRNETLATRIIDGSSPIPPTMKDGFSTRIQFATDEVRVQAEGGPYARWGHEAVKTLLNCWAPLIPETSSRYWERPAS